MGWRSGRERLVPAPRRVRCGGRFCAGGEAEEGRGAAAGGLGAVTGGAGGQRAWEGAFVDLFAPWSLAPLLILRRGKISAW